MIANLEPRAVWEQFEAITRVPRPSKKEEKIHDWLVSFAKAHHLDYQTDQTGNVTIRAKASKGYEDHPTVVLQSHMDMVCEKTAASRHDFEKDSIKAHVEEGWVRADGTTLGADDGIGMAAALAALIDPALPHGPLEALFTVDEETGLTGAFGLGEGMITGRYLINLDSEDEGEIFIGCAGGVDSLATFHYTPEPTPVGHALYVIKIGGLSGGHSGDDIDKGRMNANKLLARFLLAATDRFEVRLNRFDGGNLRNAIPREASAVIAVPELRRAEFEAFSAGFIKDLKAEAVNRESKFTMTVEALRNTSEGYDFTGQAAAAGAFGEPAATMVIDFATQQRLLASLVGLPNGVLEMSQKMPGLVETSSNLASVKFESGDRIVVTTSQRSDAESGKEHARAAVASVFKLSGASVQHSDGYPGWTPDPSSALLKTTSEAYQFLFGTAPKVRAIHAGLECGLFLQKYPHLQMVSFGPTLRGVHSPDERLEVVSVEKFWKLLAEVLKRI